MAKSRKGTGHNRRIVLVASRFNESITQALVAAARDELKRHGVPEGAIRLVWVPGAFELPFAASMLARRLRPDAVIALGCVIKGQTPQYAAIGNAAAQALACVSVTAQRPVTFGVIIAESVAQAKARAGGHRGNRGREAASAALELLDVARHLRRRIAIVHA